jgi:hypothetical protein
MIRRTFLPFIMIMVLTTTGCIKETYDMNRLSDEAQLSPYFGVSAISGNFAFTQLDFNFSIHIDTLVITETVENFMKVEGSGKDDPFKPENFELLGVSILAKNGYPLRVALEMSLFDSVKNIVTTKIPAVAKPFLEAAPVDSNGDVLVNGITETETSIEFSREFLKAIPLSDKVILRFIFTTPGNGTKDVKMSTKYRLYFKAALIIKPVIKLK